MLATNAVELMEDYFADIWSGQTSSTPDNWTGENPACGQCAITALAVQKYLGGEILECRISFRDSDTPVSHYWNMIGEEDIDVTYIQFQHRKIRDEVFVGIASKESLLSDPDTRKRYEILLEALKAKDPLNFFLSLK